MSYGQQTAPDIVLTLDLGVARVAQQIVAPGIGITQVYIATLPSGADCRLRYGVNNPPVPSVQTGGRISPVAIFDGLYLDNNAQPGLTVVIAIATGSKRA